MRPHSLLITLGASILAFVVGVELGAWRAQPLGPVVSRHVQSEPAPGSERIPDGPAPRGAVVEPVEVLPRVAPEDVDEPATAVPDAPPAAPTAPPVDFSASAEITPGRDEPAEPPLAPAPPVAPQVLGLVPLEEDVPPVTMVMPAEPSVPAPAPVPFEAPPEVPGLLAPTLSLPAAANVPGAAADDGVVLLPPREAAAPEPSFGAPAAPVDAAAISPEAVYHRGYAAYEAERYAEAEQALQQFLVDYPDSPLADNAMYWIAECNYSRRDFAEAAENFALVAALHPDGDKVPDALLKEAYALANLGRGPEARVLLERLVAEHSGSRAAALAGDRLAAME